MLKLIKWLIGYVEFSFCCGFCEGFINDCFSAGLNIQNIKTKDKTVYAVCPAGLYPQLRAFAKNNGGRLKIIKKHGLIFILEKIKNRWGIFAGLLAGIVFISFISGFVWNIQITGNNRLSDEEIRTFLSGCGFYEGACWKNIDKDKTQSLLLASFDDISWAHINRDGTFATVEINEAVIKPKTQNRKAVANLKADKSGIIVKTEVYDGWAKVKKGDAVEKGDLLVSGVYSGKKGNAQFTRARGKIIAKVKEDFSLTVNRNQSKKVIIRQKRQKSLIFFSLEIPLYIGKTPKNSELESSCKYLRLNNKNLPLGIKTSVVKTYKEEVKTLSDGELAALMNKEIDKKLKSDYSKYEIVSKDISTALNDSCAAAKGNVYCLEDIGKEVKIKVKKDKK